MSSEKQYANAAPGAVGVDKNHPASVGYRIGVIDGPGGKTALVEGEAKRKNIAICGFAASSRDQAPFDDPEWEIWGLNQLYRHIPRATRWFDIHANWREDNVPGTDHPAWLAQCEMPIYMSSYEPSLPTCVNYPLAEVIERVSGVDYFTSTVSYMVALAILEADNDVAKEITFSPGEPYSVQAVLAKQRELYGQRKIALFGIDLIVGTEYDWQKACVEYYLGIAHARGINVVLPEACALLKQQWRYGYETQPKDGHLKGPELDKRAQALNAERNKLISQLQTLDGALQENGYWRQVYDLRSKGGTVKLNEDT